MKTCDILKDAIKTASNCSAGRLTCKAAADGDADWPSLAAYVQLKGGFHDWAGNRFKIRVRF